MMYQITSIALAAALISGCAASIPPIQVTRFNVGTAIAPGGIRIEPASAAPSDLEFATYAGVVSRQLAAIGFGDASGVASRVGSGVGSSAPAYIVNIGVTRESRDVPRSGSPITIGIGGGTGGFGGGVGLGTSFGIGGKGARTEVFTTLSVRIKRAADQTAVWEGRAETRSAANAPAAQPGLAADKLAAALFKDFPGTSGETITVP